MFPFFISRKNTCKLCCFAHSRCHIGYNLNTGSNFNFSSSAVKCYVRVSVYKRYTVSKGKRRKLYVQFKRNFFLEKKGILIIMKVAQLRLQQDQKWLITSNCLHREADYHILRVSGLNCYLWAEFQWTLVLIKCIGCWYFHHAGVTFEEKARRLTLRESNLVTCSSQRGFSACGQPY